MQLKTIPEDFEVTERIDTASLLREDGGGAYVYLWLTKRDYDHFRALEQLSSVLGVRTRQIHYAGTKDRRAITHQLISVQHLGKEKLANRLPQLAERFGDDLSLEEVGRGDTRLQLGMNTGNHFTIVLRALFDADYDHIRSSFAAMQEQGVLNLFGTQRFGFAGNSHKIGQAILQGELRQAFWEILTALPDDPSPEREEFVSVLKTHWDALEQRDTKTINWLAEQVPAFFKEAKGILSHLCREPGDVHGAFRTIPKKLRTLYLHAYQAHLFNTVARTLHEEGRTDIETLPLLSVHTTFHDERVRGHYEKQLEADGLNYEAFRLPSMPELVPPWEERRPLYLHITEGSCSASYEDTYHPDQKACTLSFTLPKGAYATTVIEQLDPERKTIV